MQVLTFADDGTATPPARTVVSGGGAPEATNAFGNTLVSVRRTGPRQIPATLGDDVPSKATPVCSVRRGSPDFTAAGRRLIVGSEQNRPDPRDRPATNQMKPRARRRRVPRPGPATTGSIVSRKQQGPRRLQQQHRFGQGRQSASSFAQTASGAAAGAQKHQRPRARSGRARCETSPSVLEPAPQRSAPRRRRFRTRLGHRPDQRLAHPSHGTTEGRTLSPEDHTRVVGPTPYYACSTADTDITTRCGGSYAH